MKRPIILILAGACAGAVFGWMTGIRLFFFVPFFLIPFFLPRPVKRYAILFIAIFALTFVRARVQKQSPLTAMEGQTVQARIRITDVGRTTAYTKNYEGSLLGDDSVLPIQFQTDTGAKDLVPGEWIRVRAEIRRPDRTQNDLLFSYSDYLLRNGKAGLLRATGTITSEGISDDFRFLLKRSFVQELDRITGALFSFDAKLLFQSVLGGKTLFSEDRQAVFRDLGISHLFAVSGLHIGILFGMTRLLLGRFLGKSNARLAGLAVIFLYTWLIGFPVSAMRALVMAYVLVLARRFRQGYDPLTALFFACALLLILYPGSIADPGFHLSVAGVWSVIWVRPALLTRMNREGSLFWSAFSVQLGLAPVLLFHFGQAPVAGLFANLILIPLFSLMISAAVAVMLLYLLLPVAARILSAVPQMMADVFFRLTDALANLSLPVFAPQAAGITAVLWAYLLLYLALRPNTWFGLPKTDRSGLLRALFASFAVGILLLRFQPPTVLFLDIGQGDASLILDGGQALLIDTGGEAREELADSLENILLPSLAREGVYRLDGVFITHLDADHAENLAGLLEAIPVDTVFIPAGIAKTEEGRAWTDSISAGRSRIAALSAGSAIGLSSGSRIEVLHDADFGEANDSFVLRYNTGRHTVLFPGDLEEAGEKKLNIDLKADILKAGHHGSRGSSSDSFLDRVEPGLAVIAAGHRNTYGHPHQETLDRFRDRNVLVFRTDLEGNVRLRLGAGALQADVYPSLQIGLAELLSLGGLIPVAYYCRKRSKEYYATNCISKITE